jgi:transposase-like protein
MPATYTKYTPQRARAFLAIIEAGGSVTKAAIAAKVCRKTPYLWRDNHPEFKVGWKEAEEIGTDLIEDVSVDRALNGNDTQIIFQLKARRPEKYKDRGQQDLNVSGGLTVKVEGEDAAL